MAEHMQAIACRSIEGLLATLFDTTGHLPKVEPSCEYLGEVNANTGFIVCVFEQSEPI